MIGFVCVVTDFVSGVFAETVDTLEPIRKNSVFAIFFLELVLHSAAAAAAAATAEAVRRQPRFTLFHLWVYVCDWRATGHQHEMFSRPIWQ